MFSDKEIEEERKREEKKKKEQQQLKDKLYKEIISCIDLNTKIKQGIKPDKKGAAKDLKCCIVNYKYLTDIYFNLKELEEGTEQKTVFVVSDEIKQYAK